MAETGEPAGRKWSRRQALGLIAAGGGAVATAKLAEAVPLQAASWEEATGSILVARGSDGLLLTLNLVNVEIEPAGIFSGPRLKLQNPALEGYLILALKSQSVFELAVFDDGTGAPAPSTPVPALASGDSRIVLRMEPGSAPVDYKLSTLLALPLNVSPVANDGSATLPMKPAPTHTAIEAPFRLHLSPTEAAVFTAATAPIARNGRTELWHARAVTKASPFKPDPVPFRAIWSDDLPDGSPIAGAPWATHPDTASLLPADRVDIVEATTQTAPANANLLLVSAMGASLDVQGNWPDRLDLVAWRHRSSLGRDNYVKVEKPGFLFPLRFPAVKVSITERVHNGGLAHLRKQEFIVVRVPKVAYTGNAPQPAGGRHWPFTEVETTTLVSPPLVRPSRREPLGQGEWVQIAGADGNPADLRYRLIFTSHGGHPLTADLPMVFIPSTAPAAFDPAQMASTVAAYQAAAEPRRTLTLGGQRLSFVPELGEDPALPAFDLLVGAHPATAGTQDLRELAAYPRMMRAGVRIEALDSVNPESVARQAEPHTIQLAGEYLTNGFGGAANAGELWATVAEPPKLEVPQQIGGGLAAPALDVGGLSRAHGPVSDVAEIAKGNFNPEAYFPLDDINLLGGIPLSKVIKQALSIPDPRGPEGENVPKVVTKRSPQAVETVVTWRPVLQEALEGLFEPATAEADKRLELKAVFRTDLGTGQVSTVVTGELRGFALNFVGKGALGFVRQPVTRLRFESRDGGKPVIDIQLDQATFLGDLRFLDELKNHLPALPGGVKIDLTPAGVSAGLDIALPAVPIGVLLIQNLGIGVLLNLPFNGDQAVLTFSFATREHPFQVTVSALGGGGFLAIGLGTRGVQQIEGALEFGAAVAIDLGVASGSITIMAGIYFKYSQRQLGDGSPDGAVGKTLVITGYVRAIGRVSVLGLIHVSVEFYLGLTYLKEQGRQGRVQGVATLKIRVEVLLFSKTVSVTMRKEFAAGPDPSFGQQITAGDWAKYCAAFAAA